MQETLMMRWEVKCHLQGFSKLLQMELTDRQAANRLKDKLDHLMFLIWEEDRGISVSLPTKTHLLGREISSTTVEGQILQASNNQVIKNFPK